jgi:hypothetical protein
MHQITEISCPACRAKQALNCCCRRCEADLQLYLHAVNSLNAASRRYTLATARSDIQSAEKELDYLRWLSPTFAAQLRSKEQTS